MEFLLENPSGTVQYQILWGGGNIFALDVKEASNVPFLS